MLTLGHFFTLILAGPASLLLVVYPICCFFFLDLCILRVGLRRLLPQELAEKRDTLVGNGIDIFYA